jgi:AbrB family looped-hinge helix DNA binding protein
VGKMIVKCDERGRIYLPKSVREKLGKGFYLVEMKSGIHLIPVPDDPVKTLEEIGKKLPEKSLKELKKDIRKQAMEELK